MVKKANEKIKINFKILKSQKSIDTFYMLYSLCVCVCVCVCVCMHACVCV